MKSILLFAWLLLLATIDTLLLGRTPEEQMEEGAQ